MLDMLQGGPKLRRWYGEQDMLGVGGPREEEDGYGIDKEELLPEDDSPKDTILVLDGDSPMGEQLILQLIVAREKVRALVGDPVMAKQAFGPYVEFVRGSASSLESDDAAAALKGVRTLVVTGKLGSGGASAARRAGAEHVVLLSSVGLESGGLSLGFLTGSEDAVLKDARREALVAAAGLPYTVVRVGAVQDVPGGDSTIRLIPDGTPQGKISREDVAEVLSQAAAKQPAAGLSLTVDSQPGEATTSWVESLEALVAGSVAS